MSGKTTAQRHRAIEIALTKEAQFQMVDRLGLLEASRQMLRDEGAIKIASRQRELVALVSRILCVEDEDIGEPFVLDEYADLYHPWSRVCVYVGEHLFNYLAAHRDDKKPTLQLVVGRCTSCAQRPIMFPVATLADVARILDSPVNERSRSICWKCRKDDD